MKIYVNPQYEVKSAAVITVIADLFWFSSRTRVSCNYKIPVLHRFRQRKGHRPLSQKPQAASNGTHHGCHGGGGGGGGMKLRIYTHAYVYIFRQRACSDSYLAGCSSPLLVNIARLGLGRPMEARRMSHTSAAALQTFASNAALVATGPSSIPAVPAAPTGAADCAVQLLAPPSLASSIPAVPSISHTHTHTHAHACTDAHAHVRMRTPAGTRGPALSPPT